MGKGRSSTGPPQGVHTAETHHCSEQIPRRDRHSGPVHHHRPVQRCGLQDDGHTRATKSHTTRNTSSNGMRRRRWKPSHFDYPLEKEGRGGGAGGA